MKRKMPEEYENVLVTSPEGKQIVAHRNGTRWYGYTLLEWLTFEPTEFIPLGDIHALRAENARLKERCEALQELVEALDELVEAENRKVNAEWRESEYSDGSPEATQVYEAALSHWDHVDYKVSDARAKLAALGEPCPK